MASGLDHPVRKVSIMHTTRRQLVHVFVLLTLILTPWAVQAKSEHEIYFKGTDYELHVFEIIGDYPGNTLLIIGGMHNEPGGYLSADLYADLSLRQGRLIVVPRANFPAIVSNDRKIHSDMNRKFVNGNGKKHQNHKKEEYEEAVVAILMELMSRSDALLNLHDGSGFFRPKYIDKWRNPLRWGQSIISDTDVHITADGRTLNLKDRIDRVIATVNLHIEEPEHYFFHNNTRTFDDDSPHKEQRGSATYYALTEYGIESYGVETSKSIKSLDLKVEYQSMIINAFMNEYNIVPKNPKVSIQDPHLEYLLVSVNGSFPFGVPDKKTLYVNSGDRIRIEHIAANYERGLLADIKGVGSLNDMNKEFVVRKPSTILVKKDKFEAGKIFVDIRKPDKVLPVMAAGKNTPQGASQATAREGVVQFLVLVNNDSRTIPDGNTLEITPSDILTIQEVIPVEGNPRDLRVNFVGFVGNKAYNDAEDRGYRIHPSKLWKRHSLDKKGGIYRVDARLQDRSVGEIFVRILQPTEAR